MKALHLFALLLISLFAGAQSITLTYPDLTRPVWKPGFNQTLTWNTTGTIPNVHILRSENSNGFVWDTIAANIPNTGSYVWNVSGSPGTYGIIRVVDVTGATTQNIHGLYIVGPVIKVNAGNAAYTGCSGDTAHLFANANVDMGIPVIGPPPPPAPLTYSWTPANTLSHPDSSFTIATPTASYTLYIVNVTDGTYTGADTVPVISNVPSVTITNTGNGILPDTLVANATGSGNCSAYAYTWSQAATSQSIAVSAAGTYSVTVINNCGCTATASTYVSNKSITVTSPNSASGYLVGETEDAKWTSTGNIPKVKIEMYNSITTNWTILTDSVVNNGKFTFQMPATPMQSRIRVSDPYNPAVFDESNQLFNVVAGPLMWHWMYAFIDTTICAGKSIARGTTAKGGAPPYTYQWSGGPGISNPNAPTPMFTPIDTLTIYSVTVTDNVGNTITDIAPIHTIPNLNSTISFHVVHGSCANLGRIVTQSGGVQPESFLWSNGSTDEHPMNLAPGIHTLTVTDAVGCQGVGHAIVNKPPSITIDFFHAAPTCNTNIVEAWYNCTVTQPVTYAWSNGDTDHENWGVPSGIYTVTITDGAGCTGTASHIKPHCTAMQLSASVQNAGCFGSATGSITATATNGTPPYQYTINGGATWQSTGVFNNLLADDYVVGVKDADDTLDITTATVLNATEVGVIINNNNDGVYPDTLTTTVIGTCAPYQYLWSTNASTQDITVTTDGTYTVTVTNSCGCSGTALVHMNTPQPPIVNAGAPQYGCAGAQFMLGGSPTASGGTGPYSYQWSPAINLSCTNCTNPTATPTATTTYRVTVTDANNQTATDSVTITLGYIPVSIIQNSDGQLPDTLQAGVSSNCAPFQYSWSNTASTDMIIVGVNNTYTVTVTDNCGCSGTASTLVGPFQASITNFTDVSCFNGTDGSITITASGGATPYTINGGNTFTGSHTFSNLAPGAYSYNVTDANNTTVVLSHTVVQPAAPLMVNLTSTPATCNGAATGSICASVTGGASMYTYLWNMGQTIQCPAGLPAGTYFVTITDANGCTVSSSATVTQPAALTATLTATDAACGQNNGSITANVGGGTAPYLLQWSNGVPDNLPVPGTSSISGLSPYGYGLHVMDGNGCEIIVYDTVKQNSTLQLNLSITGDGTYPDTLNYNVTGGTPPFNYVPIPASWGTYPVINGPAAYGMQVTDGAGCVVADSISWPPAASGITVIYPNGGETFTVGQNVNVTWSSTGSIPKVKIELYSSIAFNWITLVDSVANTGSYSYTIPSVPNMQAKIRVSDPYNASVNDESDALFNIVQAGTLVVNAGSIVNNACFGGNNGSVTLSATGGTAPYQYTIDGGATYQSSGTFNNLPAGTYTALVKDATNATATTTFTITQPAAPLAVGLTSTDVTCNGGANGSICATVTGGTPMYTYMWSMGQVIDCPLNLPAGTYSITVTDANGCTVGSTVTLTEPAALTVNTLLLTDGTYPDTLIITATGGTPPYNYQPLPASWITFPIITQNGTYSFAVTDANGCAVTDSVTSPACVGCVWPGDANYDGVVDNTDLLPIGLGYGTTGTSRTQQDINWYGHASTDWADTLLSGTNYKHLDCNGNGTINAADTLAILLNYNETHPRSGMDEIRGGVPQLRIEMVPDTLADGETVVAHLFLGDSLNTATDVYGLAFTFNFDATVVDSTEVSIQFNNNSWLCNNAADHIDIDKKFYGTGQIKTALTRIDHTMRSGSGEIGNVNMKITTGNINGKNLAYYAMHCYITDLVMIDNLGNYLAVDPSIDSATIEYEPTGIAEISLNNGVSIYPNPATNVLNIRSKQHNVEQFTIINLLGEVMVSGKPQNGNNVTVNTSQLAEGVYIIRVQSGNNEFVGRFTKQ